MARPVVRIPRRKHGGAWLRAMLSYHCRKQGCYAEFDQHGAIIHGFKRYKAYHQYQEERRKLFFKQILFRGMYDKEQIIKAHVKGLYEQV